MQKLTGEAIKIKVTICEIKATSTSKLAIFGESVLAGQ